MEPLRANSWAEAHLYLMVTPCPGCGKGPWQAERTPSPEAPQNSPSSVWATCRHCSAKREFVFRCPPPPTDAENANVDSPLRWINPTPQPSALIDVAQWLGLFHMLVESAGRAANPHEGRRMTFQAAQCLDEALKFYSPEDELPPPSAMFADSSRQAFADHPEKFARQRLLDLRSKLPGRGLMARRLQRDHATPQSGKWWQFWRR